MQGIVEASLRVCIHSRAAQASASKHIHRDYAGVSNLRTA